MLTFCLLVSQTGGPLPEHVLERLRDPACPEVPFEARHHLVWSNASRTVWFAGWQDGSEGASASHHWHVDDHGLTAFTGQVWPRLDGWRRADPWAEQLAELLSSTPLRAGTDDLAGVFVALSLGHRGPSSVAADPLGIGLTHWGHGREFVAISSRASLAAAVLAAESSSEPVRDAVGTGWLAYCVYANGLQTGFEQVTVVPEGGCIEIGPAGGARFVPAARSPWRPDPASAASAAAMLEEARREMVTAIRMALSRPGRSAFAELTGGKDSRLVLALLLEEGLTDEIEFQTYGGPDLRDVLVARELAARFGLRHTVDSDEVCDAAAVRRERIRAWRRRVNSSVRDHGHEAMSAREISFRITAWSGSGMNNVEKPLLGRPPSGREVWLTGGCGETFRTAYGFSSRFASKGDAARFPNRMGFGSASILRPEVHEHYRQKMHRVLFDGSLTSDSPQDVVDAFFFRQRLRRWLGTAHELDSHGRTFPLYSITAVRLAFAIGSESRQAEWIHFQLMRRACEPLVHIGFADSGWPAGASGDLVPSRRHHERAPPLPPRLPAFQKRSRSYVRRLGGSSRRPATSNPGPRTVAADRRADTQAVDVALMRRYLLDDPSARHHELFDREAVRTSLDRFTELGEVQKAQLYGALTAAIWLGGHEITLPRGVGDSAS